MTTVVLQFNYKQVPERKPMSQMILSAVWGLGSNAATALPDRRGYGSMPHDTGSGRTL